MLKTLSIVLTGAVLFAAPMARADMAPYPHPHPPLPHPDPNDPRIVRPVNPQQKVTNQVPPSDEPPATQTGTSSSH